MARSGGETSIQNVASVGLEWAVYAAVLVMSFVRSVALQLLFDLRGGLLVQR